MFKKDKKFNELKNLTNEEVKENDNENENDGYLRYFFPFLGSNTIIIRF